MAHGPSSYLLPIVVSLLFVGGFLLLVLSQTRQQRAVWSAFAARREWDFTASGRTSNVMEIQGLHQGHQVSLLTERRGSGRSSYAVTVLRVDLRDAVPRQLSLSSEDRPFHVIEGKEGQARDAALQQGLLQEPRVRRHLLELGQTYLRYSIEVRLLEAEHRGIPKTVEALEAVVAPALELVDALDAAAHGSGERRA
ncbi:hypothetical protein [Pyxidicoccus trucidator]|uniref:hypothetical protein n=1 Tax=Pyxidicoccus trucidator TaxID=2709662 RepID=UPI0013D918EF|nr:hypothetical protein [Pyxidicoccus trucidator]